MSSVTTLQKLNMQPQPIARKCIVCGTTKHECNMKPFLLKGEQLTLWTTSYFGTKRNKVCNFYAKLRYTLNPYSCIEHFIIPARAFADSAKYTKRVAAGKVKDNEEPPSIEKITEKKPDPPPPEPVKEKSQAEIQDAVMAILKKARVEIDNDDYRKKQLMKISRKMVDNDSEVPFNEATTRKKKKKKKRRIREEKEEDKKKVAVPDGNEADDSDASEGTIDVERLDSESESGSGSETTGSSVNSSSNDGETANNDSETTSSSGSDDDSDGSTSSSSSDDEPQSVPPTETSVIYHQQPPPHIVTTANLPITPVPTPPRTAKPVVVIPRKMLSSRRPYMIADPSSSAAAARSKLSKPTDGRPTLPAMMMMKNIPKRLTPAPVVPQKPYSRASWITPQPGGAPTLASVLQKFWNEDVVTPPPAPKLHEIPKPGIFGRHILPGTTTRFMPVSRIGAYPPTAIIPSNDISSKSPIFRIPMLPMHNPPLSPSRLIVGSEETVETTTHSDEEKVELISSSSSSSEEESDVEVEVEAHSERGLVVVPEGQKIEGVVLKPPVEYDEEEGERSRSQSISLHAPQSTITSTANEEDVDVDVVTVEDEGEKEKEVEKNKKTVDVVIVGQRPPIRSPEKLLVDSSTTKPAPKENRRKQSLSVYRHAGATPVQVVSSKPVLYYHTASQHRRIILPPSATVKPPTRLLSSGNYFSMKELMQAQARAAAKSVRIGTRNVVNTLKRPMHPRPPGMPRLKMEEFGGKRESEWSRLERVVEAKLAEKREADEMAKKRRMHNMVDPQVMAENSPPLLDREESEENKISMKGDIIRLNGGADHGLAKAIIDSMIKGKIDMRSKVLRMRFHKKGEEEEVVVTKMKMLGRDTRPLGVGREEEVRDCAVVDMNQPISLRIREKRQKEAENDKKMIGGQVKKKQLVIAKKDFEALQTMNKHKRNLKAPSMPSEIIELTDDMPVNAPPPTPVVGLPDKEERTARRLMYEQKRHEQMIAATLKYGRGVKLNRADWRKKRADLTRVAVPAHPPTVVVDDSPIDMQELALEAEVMEIVRRVKEAKMKMGEQSEQRRRDEEANICVLSDIEDDKEEPEVTAEKEKEEDVDVDVESVEEKEEGQKEENEKTDEKDSDDGVKRRVSHRLEIKRKLGKADSIWQKAYDATPSQEEDPATPRKKRGRPRKGAPSTEPPPPKKKSKREEKKRMDDTEREVLARVLKKDFSVDNPEKKGEDLTVERTDDESQNEGETEKWSGTTDGRPSKRRKKIWSWTEKLNHDLTVNTEMGGRLCNYCMKHTKRYIWVANSPIALMDHARTHCVETLMCPNANCTYMNTQRARISQHVSYVHKKWGMPIDLAELYPSIRASLLMRLRQSFPDMSGVAVCRICRVAVKPERNLLRWHAQSHLDTQIFECSRDICTLKFYSELECMEHIRQTKCRGTVKSGMTEELFAEVSQLMVECFESVELEEARKIARMSQSRDSESHNDREVHSSTSSTATASRSSSSRLQEDKETVEEEEEMDKDEEMPVLQQVDHTTPSTSS